MYSFSFFIRNIYISFNNKEIIDIDNEFEENLNENAKIFYGDRTELKPIVLYYPEFNNISYFKYFNKTLKKENINKYEINKLVNKQIKLAKDHQIYGFGIFYNLFNFNHISRITTDIILNQKKISLFYNLEK